MIEHDFHGLTVVEAEERFHQIVSDIRMCQTSEQVHFIVGHGPIRANLFWLAAYYNISIHPQLGNEGVLVAIIE